LHQPQIPAQNQQSTQHVPAQQAAKPSTTQNHQEPAASQNQGSPDEPDHQASVALSVQVRNTIYPSQVALF
jgi:hypothetical protein